ncbi:hypothetical protein [Brenneria roseae]|nr:hypothetical protein [Brenneria roseae]
MLTKEAVLRSVQVFTPTEIGAIPAKKIKAYRRVALLEAAQGGQAKV